jgi:hypothetical protein
LASCFIPLFVQVIGAVGPHVGGATMFPGLPTPRAVPIHRPPAPMFPVDHRIPPTPTHRAFQKHYIHVSTFLGLFFRFCFQIIYFSKIIVNIKTDDILCFWLEIQQNEYI